ncbi:hypothetical protein CYMTET_47558 [Cymbomonas tetramitiformis]|uniref:Uncharacterized protein n=1 Tax=Cymbomonas tetramitiformis TaxID=36881 RepID=A0AAE0BU17_9CHLO|nr:hypothetical protein CYMTET_47558 [Cymbomonas tetramitiformis]
MTIIPYGGGGGPKGSRAVGFSMSSVERHRQPEECDPCIAIAFELAYKAHLGTPEHGSTVSRLPSVHVQEREPRRGSREAFNIPAPARPASTTRQPASRDSFHKRFPRDGAPITSHKSLARARLATASVGNLIPPAQAAGGRAPFAKEGTDVANPSAERITREMPSAKRQMLQPAPSAEPSSPPSKGRSLLYGISLLLVVQGLNTAYFSHYSQQSLVTPLAVPAIPQDMDASKDSDHSGEAGAETQARAPEVVVVTFCLGPEYIAFREGIHCNHAGYAAAKGYRYFSESDLTHSSNQHKKGEPQYSVWTKIAYFERLLARHDFVLWVDCSTLLVDFSLGVSEIRKLASRTCPPATGDHGDNDMACYRNEQRMAAARWLGSNVALLERSKELLYDINQLASMTAQHNKQHIHNLYSTLLKYNPTRLRKTHDSMTQVAVVASSPQARSQTFSISALVSATSPCIGRPGCNPALLRFARDAACPDGHGYRAVLREGALGMHDRTGCPTCMKGCAAVYTQERWMWFGGCGSHAGAVDEECWMKFAEEYLQVMKSLRRNANLSVECVASFNSEHLSLGRQASHKQSSRQNPEHSVGTGNATDDRVTDDLGAYSESVQTCNATHRAGGKKCPVIEVEKVCVQYQHIAKRNAEANLPTYLKFSMEHGSAPPQPPMPPMVALYANPPMSESAIFNLNNWISQTWEFLTSTARDYGLVRPSAAFPQSPLSPS